LKKKARVVTHHHHTFLKQAYALGDNIELFNTNAFKHGQSYVAFNPTHELFMVWVKRNDGDRACAGYRTLTEAVFKANTI
jgi:hypothetical protein